MLFPPAVFGMQLGFPGNATKAVEKVTPHGSYAMPVSGWQGNAINTVAANGEVTKQAWKINATGLTTLQILEPLRKQLVEDGFVILFECETAACGGFDFRFNTDVIPEPAMHVDLGDFRFLSARKGGEDGPEFVSLLVSRSNNAGFVQLVRVGKPMARTEVTTSTKNPDLVTLENSPATGENHAETSLENALEDKGFFVLEDLAFKTGSSDLGDGKFSSLASLAEYLTSHPDRKVALVGHTDAEGSLAGNIALSKKRARSVMQRLISEFGVDKKQLSAEGNGFLSPRASNLTEEGRSQNRRVEVIVTSTQ